MVRSISEKYRGSGVFVKLPGGALREMDRLVEKGEYLNRTHLVRRAVEEFIEDRKRQERGEQLERCSHSLDEEAVDLVDDGGGKMTRKVYNEAWLRCRAPRGYPEAVRLIGGGDLSRGMRMAVREAALRRGIRIGVRAHRPRRAKTS